MIKPLIIAFAMYSKIPMPIVDWNEKNMRHAFCYFPLIGLVIGLIQILAAKLLTFAGAGYLIRGAVLCVIPLIVTGGIHLDGFMDTSDALSSYGDREKKLAILKDSHIGAFAVIRCSIYLILTVGLYSEINEKGMIVMAIAYAFERCLSGIAALYFKGAREHGMLASFEKNADKKLVIIALIIQAAVFAGLMIFAGRSESLLALVMALLMFAYYHHICMKEFGGTTGDLAGWFLQNCEIIMLASIVISEWIKNLI